MHTLIRQLCILLAGCLLLTGCGAASPSAVYFPSNPSPRAWMDAPLDNSTLSMVPYTVVFHGTDPENVAQGELTINGALAVVLPNPQNENRLAAFSWEWSPPAPGEYLLSVRTQNGQGIWSEYTEARVFVGEKTPTPTLTPTPKASAPVFINRTEPKQVFRGICSPNQVSFAVGVQPPEPVRAVYVFVKLQNASTGTMTPWNSGTAMNPAGGGEFRRTAGTSSFPDAGDFSSAYLLYQFVAEGADHQIIGRSPVFSDVVINLCGIEIFPLPLHPTWKTPTPIVVK